MCKARSQFCVLLGEKSEDWSKRAPLPPPVWFIDQLSVFADAAESLAHGQRDKAARILAGIRSEEMRVWFGDHGQASGMHRTKALGVAAKRLSDDLDPLKPPTRHEKAVFRRDCYTCRYCDTPLVAKEVLSAFERAIGRPHFCYSGRDVDIHGVVHAFKPVADHVDPHRLGGRTNADNLVTACPGCNYGKSWYSIEQLGIDDPRSRPPAQTGWDGLLHLHHGLVGNALGPK